MAIMADTVAAYLDQVPAEHKAALKQLRTIIKRNLPEGFAEGIHYGMIGYVVPHSIYPSGYRANPALPLPFISIASQKNFIAVYHMGLYANEALLQWFLSAYRKLLGQKLDMGKSCIRFKKPNEIPFELIGMLSKKLTAKEWVAIYEKSITQNKSRKIK